MPEHLQSREGSCPSAPPAPPLDLARTGSRYPAQTTPTPSRDPSSSCHSSACLGLSSTALIRSLPSTRQALKIKVGPEAGPGLEGPLALTGPGTHLSGSLDIEVVQPLQDGDPGHHPNGHVAEVAVEDLHDAIEVEGDWGPLGAVGKIREESQVGATGAGPSRPQR